MNIHKNYQHGDITDVKSVTITQCLANGTVFTPSWTYVINNMYFQPDFAYVRNINFNTNATADNNIYLIWCDLISGGDIIGSFPGCPTPAMSAQVPVYSNPETMLCIKRPIDKIYFQIFMISTTVGATYGLPVPVTSGLTSASTSLLSLQIDFVQVYKGVTKGLPHDQVSTRGY